MSIALVITEQRDAIDLLPWAIHLARIRHRNLVLIYVTRQGDQQQRTELSPNAEKEWGDYQHDVRLLDDAHFRWMRPRQDVSPGEIRKLGDDATDDALSYRLIRWQHPQPVHAVCEELKRTAVSTLIIRRDNPRRQSLDLSSVKELSGEISCEFLQIRPGAAPCRSIMVPANTGQASAVALDLAYELSESCEAALTAVYVEPNVDEYAEQVGRQILDKTVRRSLGIRSAEVKQRVVLESRIQRGIRSVVDDYDTVVLGIRRHGPIHRWLIQSVSEDLFALENGPCVIAVRPATPLAGRLVRSADRMLRQGVPQLERSQRIAVVERIQSSSKWDFDFIALICLSTLIAAGGLIQNSAAVVIGAMLVAPLMTPLLGAGLSLVQGNLVLLRNAVRSVVGGFLVAVALSFLVGWCVPGLVTTTEMAARGAPRIPDLLVAFISGIAAAYAIGRPNLLSALPGVAIAAALVPPTATLGLALSIGQWRLAAGSALLFLTNVLAIVLGTACSFLAVGVRGSHAHGAFQSRTLRIVIGLTVLLLCLGVYESLPKLKIPVSLRDEIAQYVETHGAQLVGVEWIHRSQDPMVRVTVESETPMPPVVSAEIRQMIRSAIGNPARIRLETRLVKEYTPLETGV